MEPREADRGSLVWLGLAVAAPLVGFVLLLAVPNADRRWEHHPSHFWLVLAARSPRSPSPSQSARTPAAAPTPGSSSSRWRTRRLRASSSSTRSRPPGCCSTCRTRGSCSPCRSALRWRPSTRRGPPRRSTPIAPARSCATRGSITQCSVPSSRSGPPGRWRASTAGSRPRDRDAGRLARVVAIPGVALYGMAAARYLGDRPTPVVGARRGDRSDLDPARRGPDLDGLRGGVGT